MTPDDLRFDLARSMYQSQRDRREQVRGSLATPVAALAFSVFNLSTLATRFSPQNWGDPLSIAIAFAATLSVLCLIMGAAYIVRTEWNVVYLDPPDVQELRALEDSLRQRGEVSDELIAAQMRGAMTAAYDMVYRRYFAANEQASRDRTYALRYLVVALALLAASYLLLPFQGG